MIYVGIDDTDTLDTPGTNQLAKALVAELNADFRCHLVLRHQLFPDPRVHFTSKNGSASIWLETRHQQAPGIPELKAYLRRRMLEWYVPGSDPGLCVTATVPDEIIRYGQRCQRELMNQQIARDLAAKHDIYLEGLGGTEGGVIGALAAVGLAAGNDDGRVVVYGEHPDDLTGPVPIAEIRARTIIIRSLDTHRDLTTGTVDVGKHLRPNYRQGRVILFVESSPINPAPDQWQAVRLL